MKTKLVGLLVLLLIGVAACKYDDDALWNKLNSLEERIASLENKLSQMNSDISAMSTIVNALENKISISKVEKTENGYKIMFTDGKEILLKNGEEGKDAPTISIDKEDGGYYWVQIIDGKKSWLTDENGNKIPVTGEGAVTPILKVSAKGYWLISYDRGVTFKEILDENDKPVKAVGENGKDGTDGKDGEDGKDGANGTNAVSFFKDVKVDEENSELVLTLKDGTVLRIPMKKGDEESSVATVKIKGSVDLESLDGLMVQSFVDELVLNQKDFSLNVMSNDLPQLVYVTDEKDNILMMARGYFQEQPAEINARSTALALISMWSPFVSYNEEDFQIVSEHILKASAFSSVEEEISKVIKQKSGIYNVSNTAMYAAIQNLLDELLTQSTTLKSGYYGAEISGINSEHLDVRALLSSGDPLLGASNVVTIRNTGLRPPYECDLYYGAEHKERKMIKSTESIGVVALGKALFEKHFYGSATQFTLEEVGEYYFFCDKMTQNSRELLATYIFSDYLSACGIPFIHDYHTCIMDIVSLITGATIDWSPKIIFPALKSAFDCASPSIKRELGEKGLKKVIELMTGTELVLFAYDFFKGQINAGIRYNMFLTSVNPIQFHLCYDGEVITCCTNIKLKVIAGNEQIGNPNRQLNLPLTVAIENETEDGNIVYDEFIKVKYEIVSGGGFVDNEIVVVDRISNMASTNWTLGHTGEQKIRAVAYNVITHTEVSNPVYFTADLTYNVITDRAEVSGTNVTLYATLQGYDTNAITYGVCYSTENEPASNNGIIVSGSNIENCNYSVQLSSLAENQTYYWRAYMRKNMEYIYGEVKSFTTNIPILDDERDILVAFYKATGGDNWTNNENWCSEKPLSEWYGIRTNSEGKIDGIELNRNNLTGSGSLAGLEHLSVAQFIGNQLTGLDLSDCLMLELLDCRENQTITTLGLSGCMALETLYATDNQIESLDLSDCFNLQDLYCAHNQLVHLDVSHSPLLNQLQCGNNLLKNLNVEGCTKLSSLFCNDNQITGEMNLSNLDNLKYLILTSNQLTSINVSNCPILDYMLCEKNQLKSINIKGCTKLYLLNCTGNAVEVIYLDQDPGSLKYDPSGNRNSSTYPLPGHKNGYQFPLFVYV